MSKGDGHADRGLVQQMREAEEARRLIARLTGEMLPEAKFFDAEARHETLRTYAPDRAVIYFVPGNKDGGYPTLDTAQHRGYVNRKAFFDALWVRVISISSQPMSTLFRVGHHFDFSHFMLSDSDLTIADALDLPTVQDGDIRRYRRLTLVTSKARIVKVFYPVSATSSARQVMAWIQAGGSL